MCEKANAVTKVLVFVFCVFSQFVEKRREMKSDGRTDKELMESYCFLLTDTLKVSFPSEMVLINY